MVIKYQFCAFHQSVASQICNRANFLNNVLKFCWPLILYDFVNFKSAYEMRITHCKPELTARVAAVSVLRANSALNYKCMFADYFRIRTAMS